MENFISLWKIISNPFVRITEIFNSKFFSERRHLHFFTTAVIIFILFFFGDDVKSLQLEYVPSVIKVVFSWLVSYIINFSREWYLKVKGRAKWDIIDIYAGCYGGAIGCIIYLISR